MALLFFLVSFGTSVAGGICGIGGGVIIKPVLDFWGIASVAAASFLSGCTVLSMSFYNVGAHLWPWAPPRAGFWEAASFPGCGVSPLLRAPSARSSPSAC